MIISLLSLRRHRFKGGPGLTPNMAQAWEGIPESIRGGVNIYLDSDPHQACYYPLTEHKGIYMGLSYEDRPQEEIRGVMLHELGHVREGGTIKLFALGSLLLNEFTVYLALYNVLLLNFAGFPGHSWVPLAVYSLLFFNNALVTPLVAKHRRNRELAADAYAVQHGAGLGLYLNLSLNGAVKPGPNKLGFMGMMVSTHPTTEYRLKRMERLGVTVPEPSPILTYGG